MHYENTFFEQEFTEFEIKSEKIKRAKKCKFWCINCVVDMPPVVFFQFCGQ